MGRTKCSQRGEVTMDEGSLVTETACQIGVTQQSLYGGRTAYGGAMRVPTPWRASVVYAEKVRVSSGLRCKWWALVDSNH